MVLIVIYDDVVPKIVHMQLYIQRGHDVAEVSNLFSFLLGTDDLVCMTTVHDGSELLAYPFSIFMRGGNVALRTVSFKDGQVRLARQGIMVTALPDSVYSCILLRIVFGGVTVVVIANTILDGVPGNVSGGVIGGYLVISHRS